MLADDIQFERKRVLVNAFAVSPCRGSEHGVGWNVVTRMAKYHDVTVLYGDIGRTPEKRQEVESWLKKNGSVEGLQFEYVEQGPLGSFLFKIAHHFRPLVFLYYAAYRCWHRRAYRKAQEIHAEQPFDVVHMLTYISYREPGYLWKLDAPFFWGPINGADNIPISYFPLMSLEAICRYVFRNFVNCYQRRGSRNVRNAAGKAYHIWVVSDDDYKMVSRLCGQEKVSRLPITGTTINTGTTMLRSYSGDRPLRMVWSGLLEGRKALPILLNAMAGLKDPDTVRLTVLGDGPERNRWGAMAADLGINELIEWTGKLPLKEAQQKMAEADVFVLTSIKEGTPTVMMEALSFGLPVICHDACGMAPVIDDSCGIKIPMQNPDDSAIGFCNAIQRFVDDPELVQKLSLGVLDCMERFSWDRNLEQMVTAYENAIR